MLGLLVRDPADTRVDAQVLDLATGQQIDLPRSARAQALGVSDAWAVSRPTRELIREDGAETVDIFNWPALTLGASFKLATQTSPDEKAKLLRLRMSHDGKYLAAYEFATNSSRKTRALVFNRQGQILLTGSYQEADGGGGFDWLPDGRLAYFEKGQVLIYDPVQNQSAAVAIQFPPEARAGNENLAVSPDGKTLAVVKWAGLRNSKGETREVPVLYRAPVLGGAVSVVAQASPERIDDPVRLSMLDLSWSADGQWLSFVAQVGDDRYGGGLGVSGCPLAYAVSATASTPTLIDGVRDSDKALRAASTGGGREAVYSCGLLSWF